MNVLKKGIERPELFIAIRDSIQDARSSVRKLAEALTDNIQPLRLEESGKVFMGLTQNIQDLECFLEFILELKEGIRYYDSFNVPADPLTAHDYGLKIFNEMHTALETRDWIMLSDLIEYELSPLLIKEDEWLAALETNINAYETQHC